MNDQVLSKYADFVDEAILEKYLCYEEKIKASAKYFALRYLKIVAVACVFTIIASVAIVGLLNYQGSYVSFNDLNGIAYLKGTPSLTGVISPYPSGAVLKEISTEELKALFQKNPNDLFDVKPKNIKGEMICNPDGTIHTIRITWIFEAGYVMTIIDPKEHPQFIFNAVDEQAVKGYDVGIIYYSDAVVNGELLKDNVGIGLKKGEMGILINSPASCEKRAEELFNHIINMEIDISVFK